MSLCAEGSLTGCLITVDTSYLADEYYTKSTLLLGPPSLSITALIWVEHSASFFFVSLWIHGIIMYIKSQGSLSTVDIWMIMPQVAQALNGFFLHKHYFKNSLTLVLLFSLIIVTLLSVFLSHLTKLLLFFRANLFPMAFPLSALPFHTCLGPPTCASAQAPAVLSITPRFSPSPLISPVANILTSFHFSILHRVNVSARLFSYLTFLFLPLTSPFSILPLGGVRLSLLLLQC